jgi:hypothetical protein
MDDLKSLLPIHDMTEEQVARVISTLEEAGVEIEIDATSVGELRWAPQLVRDDAKSVPHSGARANGTGDRELISPAHAAPSVSETQPDQRARRAVILAAPMSCGTFLLAGWVWNW